MTSELSGPFEFLSVGDQRSAGLGLVDPPGRRQWPPPKQVNSYMAGKKGLTKRMMREVGKFGGGVLIYFPNFYLVKNSFF